MYCTYSLHIKYDTVLQLHEIVTLKDLEKENTFFTECTVPCLDVLEKLNLADL